MVHRDEGRSRVEVRGHSSGKDILPIGTQGHVWKMKTGGVARSHDRPFFKRTVYTANYMLVAASSTKKVL